MPITTDVVIIGAGPIGLFQIFELGLLDLHAQVVDSLPQAGGQCAKLYPEKPIYDIPAFPVVGAGELIDRLLEQIKPFKPDFHLGQIVTSLERKENGRFLLQTSAGTRFDTATVILAAGVGAFQPRRMRAPGSEAIDGKQLHYQVTRKDDFRGRHLLILGGGDSALDWTLELIDRVKSLTLVHRRTEYRGQPASVKKIKALVTANRMRELQGTVRRVNSEEGKLNNVEVLLPDGTDTFLEADEILVFWGLSPNLGPIANWGLEINKRQIPVDTEKFQTSESGIFAVGDINTYPGKKKLILSGFHETALTAFAVQKHLYPEKKVLLQYTTTSSAMHKRLGVGD